MTGVQTCALPIWRRRILRAGGCLCAVDLPLCRVALRLANFLAIAWLAAKLVHLGWMKKVAHAMPWIGTIGRQGLLCFVAGTGISLAVDSVLYQATDGYLNVPLGLAADVVAMGLLYLVAKLYAPLIARLPFGSRR